MILKPTPLKEMTEKALISFPEECCGFLFGNVTNGQYSITATLEAYNAAKSDKHLFFNISPFSYMTAERYAEQNRLALLGVYHSHPDHPALPSENDSQFALPDFFYIIISVTEQKVVAVKCWQLDENEKFREQLFDSILQF